MLKKNIIIKSKRISLEFLAKGKRGVIYKGRYNNKDIVVKFRNKRSDVDTIKNEIRYLKLLNKYGIGPKLIYYCNEFVVIEYVEGKEILDFFKEGNKKDIIDVVKNILKQLFVLDRLNINKKEMHKPIKHIIVRKENKPVMIDFERCKRVLKPKNVTQFIHFLCSNRVKNILKGKNILFDCNKLREISREYKNSNDIRLRRRLFNEINDVVNDPYDNL